MPKKTSISEMRMTAEERQQVFTESVNPLVSLKGREVNGATLSELADIVKSAHLSFQSYLGNALDAALVAGRALLAAKEQFAYDRQTQGFRGWLEEIGVSKSSAYRYIELAKNESVVSQAGTLSEAMDLLTQYRAEKRALNAGCQAVELKKRRVTLKLTSERDQKLESIAKKRGVEISALMNEILEQWLANQEDT